jgi:hypothetical protein
MNAIYKYRKLLTSHQFTPSSIRGKKFIIVFRLSKSGLIGMSKPCLGCATGMHSFKKKINLSYILYSNIIDGHTVLIREEITELIKDTSLQLSNGDSRRRYKKK